MPEICPPRNLLLLCQYFSRYVGLFSSFCQGNSNPLGIKSVVGIQKSQQNIDFFFFLLPTLRLVIGAHTTQDQFVRVGAFFFSILNMSQKCHTT